MQMMVFGGECTLYQGDRKRKNLVRGYLSVLIVASARTVARGGGFVFFFFFWICLLDGFVVEGSTGLVLSCESGRNGHVGCNRVRAVFALQGLSDSR